MHLGMRLRTRRRLMWLTQSELAAAVGVGFRQIHKYESGENSISAARLWKLAEALGVSVDYFYNGLADGRCSQARDGHGELKSIAGA